MEINFNHNEIETGNFDFPIGNMFICKSDLLKPLIKLNLQYKDFPGEPIPDTSIAHALERILPIMARVNDKRIFHPYSYTADSYSRDCMRLCMEAK